MLVSTLEIFLRVVVLVALWLPPVCASRFIGAVRSCSPLGFVLPAPFFFFWCISCCLHDPLWSLVAAPVVRHHCPRIFVCHRDWSLYAAGLHFGPIQFWSASSRGSALCCSLWSAPARRHSGLRVLSIEKLVLVYGFLYEYVPVLILSCRIKRLEVLWFKLFFHGDFLNVSISCLVKCLWGYKPFFDLIFVVDLVRGLAGIDLCFYCSS
jgi:hypothetical protein